MAGRNRESTAAAGRRNALYYHSGGVAHGHRVRRDIGEDHAVDPDNGALSDGNAF